MRALKKMLRELGGEHVLKFRFLRMDGRTSHYLVFVSKAFLGCHIMRNVMADASSRKDADGVASFEYDPHLAAQPTLGLLEDGRLKWLKDKIIEDCGGKTFTVKLLYESHSRDRRFTFSNYQDALRQLESNKRVKVTRPSGRLIYNGTPTMPNNAVVKILAP